MGPSKFLQADFNSHFFASKIKFHNEFDFYSTDRGQSANALARFACFFKEFRLRMRETEAQQATRK